jgi:hypothetical protein
MSDAPRAWVLNLDAEHELEARRRYTPTAHVRALVAAQRTRIQGALLRPDDVLVTEEDLGSGRAEGLEGVAWSPTPSALALLRAAGARFPDAPDVRVLRAVNARDFTVGVRAPLVRESFAKHIAARVDEALELLARPTPLGWLVRRAFGAAGRGRRRIASGAPSAAERAWLEASLRTGPLVLEPWVEVTREYTRSGLVLPDGTVRVSRPCFQATTEHGAWTRSEGAELDADLREDDARLEEAAAAAGAALAAAGYRGAFGVDSYRHRDPARPGAGDVLNPLSEINARYTMDWAVAMGPGEDTPALTLHRASQPK